MPEVDAICLFATVKKVCIVGEDTVASTLTFVSRSKRNQLETYTVPMSEVLVSPPTDAPKPVPRVKGAIGYLYLSKTGWDTTSTVQTGTGEKLYAQGTSRVLFKWPLCRPFRLYTGLQVVPTKIQVIGTDAKTTAPVDIDLYSNKAAPNQDIDWTGATAISIKLADGTTQQVWPTKIDVTAASVQKPHISTTLDILDVETGDFIQHITWTKLGSPIELDLSTEGFRKFKVPPGQLADFANGLRVTYPEDLVKECEILDDVDEEDVQSVVARARKRLADSKS